MKLALSHLFSCTPAEFFDLLDDPAFDHPLIFKRSGLSHDGVPRYYFERMVRHAGFSALP